MSVKDDTYDSMRDVISQAGDECVIDGDPVRCLIEPQTYAPALDGGHIDDNREGRLHVMAEDVRQKPLARARIEVDGQPCEVVQMESLFGVAYQIDFRATGRLGDLQFTPGATAPEPPEPDPNEQLFVGLEGYYPLNGLPYDVHRNAHLRPRDVGVNTGAGKDGEKSTVMTGLTNPDFFWDNDDNVWSQIGTGAFTMAAWVKFEDATSQYSVWGGIGASGGNLPVRFLQNAGTILIDMYGTRFFSSSVPNKDQWNHYLVAFDGINRARFYINGAQAGNDVNSISAGDPSNFEWGIGIGLTTGTQLFGGELIGCGIWSRDLTDEPADIALLYNGGVVNQVKKPLEFTVSLEDMPTAPNAPQRDVIQIRSCGDRDGDTGAVLTDEVVHPYWVRNLPTNFFAGGTNLTLITPFNNTDINFENMSGILNSPPSDDVFAGPWTNLANDANPLAPRPNEFGGDDTYNTDCLGWYDSADGRLHMWWREAKRNNLIIEIWHVSLANADSEFPSGRNSGSHFRMADLSPRTLVHRWPVSGEAPTTGGNCTSPSVVKRSANNWRFFMTDDEGSEPSRLVYRDATAADGTWGASQPVALHGVRWNKEPNHVEVWEENGTYYLIAMIDGVVSTTDGEVYFGESNDGGQTFFLTMRPQIALNPAGWDKGLYKTTMKLDWANDKALYFYSAQDGTGNNWGAAKTEAGLPTPTP